MTGRKRRALPRGLSCWLRSRSCSGGWRRLTQPRPVQRGSPWGGAVTPPTGTGGQTPQRPHLTVAQDRALVPSHCMVTRTWWTRDLHKAPCQADAVTVMRFRGARHEGTLGGSGGGWAERPRGQGLRAPRGMRGVRPGLGASTRTCSASIRRGGAASPACACPWGLGRCGHIAWTRGWPGVCLPPNRLCLFGRGLPASASAAVDTSRAKPVRAEGHQPPRLAQGCHVLVASPISETRNYLGTRVGGGNQAFSSK